MLVHCCDPCALGLLTRPRCVLPQSVLLCALCCSPLLLLCCSVLLYCAPAGLSLSTPLCSCTAVLPSLQDLVKGLFRSTGLADDECVEFRHEGVRRKLVFTTLENGMNLILTADVKEINASRDGLSRAIIANTALIALLSLAAMFWVSGRITKPLAKLTKAADELAQGNLDVELPPPGKDEVGILANSFAVTTSYLKEYVTSMNNLAYIDQDECIGCLACKTVCPVKVIIESGHVF